MRLVLVALVLAACGDEAAGPTALFDADADDFFALPFPNDLRRDADGTIAIAGFHTKSLVVAAYRDAADAELDGFGLNSAIYARFSAPLDPESLPDIAGSLDDDASVFLIKCATGERTPITVAFHEKKMIAIGENRLVARPAPGFPLDEHTTYALVITNRVRGANGAPIVRSDAFADVLAHAEAYAPLRATDVDVTEIVSAAVFTTQTVSSTADGLRRAVDALPPIQALTASSTRVRTSYEQFAGTYEAPNFQTGAVPYVDPGSGAIGLDAGGLATVQRMEPMRFALTVPNGDAPSAGWPLVIYQHGTGGDYQSFIDDGTAASMAASGLAVISTDQVLHGPRNPNRDPELDFFNFTNPYAMRDNALQGAADAWSQLSLASTLSITTATRTVVLDTTHVGFFGHSQGGLTGPAFVAGEPRVNGAVFSGTGGLLYEALLNKHEPYDIPGLLTGFIDDDPIDEDAPSLALLQMWVERADGENYAHVMDKNVFQTEGFTDRYTPNLCIEAFATALGSDLVQLPDTRPVDSITLRGGITRPTPIANNVGATTRVLAQFAQASGSDGHFVVFDSPTAKRMAAEFLATLAETGTATVTNP